jgi:hypothetical protein
VVHPFHPLYGQRLEVIAIRRSADPDLVVRLPDGTAAAIARSLTSAEPGDAAAAAASPTVLSPQGLRRLAALVAAMGQARRGTAATPPVSAACEPSGPLLL